MSQVEKNALERQSNAVKASDSERCLFFPPNISRIMRTDPKLIGFIAARHKLVSKIFQGQRVLEVGCQEGFGTLFVAPYVKEIICVDFFPPFIDWFNNNTAINLPNATAFVGDICKEPIGGDFDGAFALDVLEHIDSSQESAFWRNISSSIHLDGVVVIGMPSIESQVYASEASKIGHVNCKNGDQLKKEALRYFKHVLLLSMNDEMLHNGFVPMSHYIIVICSGKRLCTG
jgi:2-polyprenyl-3-methyl-5-hydroxy-6-metoxy-1,4-benzoquinol methylase